MATENSTPTTEMAPPGAEASQSATVGRPGPAGASERRAGSLEQDLSEVVPDTKNLSMLLDVGLQVTIELGRARLKVRDVLNLSSGSVIELAKAASEPVDILVNGALLASGEVVVVDDNFAVRITKLLNRVERLKKLF
jgi:flagellar motor switch protein FliN